MERSDRLFLYKYREEVSPNKGMVRLQRGSRGGL